jgi:hypothetical protein
MFLKNVCDVRSPTTETSNALASMHSELPKARNVYTKKSIPIPTAGLAEAVGGDAQAIQ